MFWGFLVSLFALGMGVMMLKFPDAYRSWNKFGNDLEGVRTEHGETFELGRMFGGAVLILVGVVGIIVMIVVAT